MTENVPPEWVGLYDGYKRDAMYYEKCLKDLRETVKDAYLGSGKTMNKKELIIVLRGIAHDVSWILQHEAQPDGVDLDKPNFGMF